MPSIDIVEADLGRIDHQQAVVDLIHAYALDPMGSGQPLPPGIRPALIPGLQQLPTTMIFLAYREGQAIGIAVCFRGFSTFAARPLINIHDLAVLPPHRGHGAGRRLLEAVERKARELECCKITLEVGEHNHEARQIYRAAGFDQTVYSPEAGGALFMSKPLAGTADVGGVRLQPDRAANQTRVDDCS
ncbi:MAG: GNAT family N-acetyltransferase [Acidobacteriota bacterium]